jgi:hypothetical protein
MGDVSTVTLAGGLPAQLSLADTATRPLRDHAATGRVLARGRRGSHLKLMAGRRVNSLFDGIYQAWVPAPRHDDRTSSVVDFVINAPAFDLTPTSFDSLNNKAESTFEPMRPVLSPIRNSLLSGVIYTPTRRQRRNQRQQH